LAVLLLVLLDTAIGCSPAFSGDALSDAPTANATSTEESTTAAPEPSCTDLQEENFKLMSPQCKQANVKEYLVVDSKACPEPCDCAENMHCVYLQGANKENSFGSNKTPLKFTCKLLPCRCLTDIGAGGSCDKDGVHVTLNETATMKKHKMMKDGKKKVMVDEETKEDSSTETKKAKADKTSAEVTEQPSSAEETTEGAESATAAGDGVSSLEKVNDAAERRKARLRKLRKQRKNFSQ